MVYRDIDEHAASQTHRYREDPVGHGPLRRRVDHDAYGHADRARDGERESVGRRGEEGPLWHHSQQRDPHRNRGEYFVEAHSPQGSPCVRLRLCHSDGYSFEHGVEA